MTERLGEDAMQGSSDGTDLLEQLIAVLRKRLALAAVREAAELVEYISTASVKPPTDPIDYAIREITEAIGNVRGEDGRALQLMTGLDPSTRSPRLTRTVILGAMANVLDPRPGSLGYGTRRVEQLEREVLAPLVAIQLGFLEPEDLPAKLRESNGGSRARTRPVFVQYCNPEIFALSGHDALLHDSTEMMRLLNRATRLALTVSDETILFPASYLFEVPVFPDFLKQAGAAREQGLFAFVSPTPDLGEFQEGKELEYRDDPTNPYLGADVRTSASGLIWKPRLGTSTAEHISNAWTVAVDKDSSSLDRVARQVATRTDATLGSVQAILRSVPERIEGRAFVGRFARGATEISLSPSESRLVDAFLSTEYLRSYLADLDATILVDFDFADLSAGLSVNIGGRKRHLVSTKALGLGLSRLGLDEYLLRKASWEDFLAVRALPGLPLVIDALAFETGSRRTEEALARVRHPTKTVGSVDDVARALERVIASLSTPATA